MAWFDDLKRCLGAHYAPGYPADIVGYLRGAPPAQWRHLAQHGSGQMMVLGNRPPSREEWAAAGVAQRGAEQCVRLSDLVGFTVLYGGFMYRPWGHIVPADPSIDYALQIASWRRNFMPPRHR